jgi:hypothetical protein
MSFIITLKLGFDSNSHMHNIFLTITELIPNTHKLMASCRFGCSMVLHPNYKIVAELHKALFFVFVFFAFLNRFNFV